MDNIAKDFAQKILSELVRIRHRLSDVPTTRIERSLRQRSVPAPTCEHPPPPVCITPNLSDPNQSQRPWYKTVDGWKTVLELVGIPFAIAYAIITFFQWRDLRHNFKVEQRAWIGYNTMAITNLKAGEPLRCDIKLLNSGKTFALEVNMPGGIQTSEVGLEDAQRQFAVKSISYIAPRSKVLFPSVEVNLPSETAERLSPAQVAAVSSGTLHVYLFADISYRDIFGDQHTTHFCGHYVPATNRFEDCGTEAN
jgi:hypothetical protein